MKESRKHKNRGRSPANCSEPFCMKMRDVPQFCTKARSSSPAGPGELAHHLRPGTRLPLRARAIMKMSREAELTSRDGPSMSHSMGPHC